MKEKGQNLTNEKERFANYQKEQGHDQLNKKIESLEAENQLVNEKSTKQEKHVIFQADKLKEMEATLKQLKTEGNAENQKELNERVEEISRLKKQIEELEQS